jgi:cysteinyl-tRNA synthetase
MLSRAPAAPGGPLAGQLAAWAIEPLHDDLNTPLALARLRDLRTLENAVTVGGSPAVVLERTGLSEAPPPGVAAAAFREAASILGIATGDPATWRQGGEDSAAIEAAIAARLAARASKNFGEADRIRDELKAQGILLEDGPGGTTWRRA